MPQRDQGRGGRDRRRYRPDRPRNERKGKQKVAPEPREIRQSSADRRAVEELLSGIGVPPARPFVPDEFQVEALEAIEHHDVLVTAPTGSGKTWIAREEIRRLLKVDKKVWYTTPLKALTNSKYVEFGKEFGDEKVGILTGDRKENADAPLIVGTTEIYRNQLFDSLRTGEDVRTDFVILDEAHYLADDDRGHVWEEAIILTPPRIRLLLLSATVGQPDVFARWIEKVRGTEVKVIDRAGSRPVELRAAYLSSDLQLYPLFDDQGFLNRTVEALTRPRKTDHRRRR